MVFWEVFSGFTAYNLVLLIFTIFFHRWKTLQVPSLFQSLLRKLQVKKTFGQGSLYNQEWWNLELLTLDGLLSCIASEVWGEPKTHLPVLYIYYYPTFFLSHVWSYSTNVFLNQNVLAFFPIFTKRPPSLIILKKSFTDMLFVIAYYISCKILII